MHLTRSRQTDRYALLLILIVLSIGTISATSSRGWGRVVAIALLGATLLVALRTSRARPRLIRVTEILVVSALVVSSLAVSQNQQLTRGMNALLIGMLAAVAPVVIARELVRHRRVTAETVLGALCIYLLVGLLFASLFGGLAELSGDPAFVQTNTPNATDYVYFSYITMATVGYGDLTPATNTGRMLAAIEGLSGQLYLVTVVALLVGNLGRDRGGDSDTE